MAFLKKADLLKYIRLDNLDAITKGDDTVLTEPMADADAMIRDFLDHRYNFTTMENDPDNDFYRTAKKCAVDLCIYELHALINPNQIPDLRMFRYEEAMKKLKELSKGAIANNLPDLPASDSPKGRLTGRSDTFIDPTY